MTTKPTLRAFAGFIESIAPDGFDLTSWWSCAIGHGIASGFLVEMERAPGPLGRPQYGEEYDPEKRKRVPITGFDAIALYFAIPWQWAEQLFGYIERRGDDLIVRENETPRTVAARVRKAAEVRS